jgi:hypothetical protein
MRDENEQLNNEIQRLRDEINRVKLDHETAIDEIRTLKIQLDERMLLANHSPLNVAVSFLVPMLIVVHASTIDRCLVVL